MFNDFEMKFEDQGNWQLKYLHVYQGIFIAETEGDYKEGRKVELEDPTFDFKVEVIDKTKYNILVINSKQLSVNIRAQEKIALEYIIYNSEQSHVNDMGRPMTFVPHLVNVESVLEEARVSSFKFQGLINLIVVALIFSHIRLMYDSFKKSGLLVKLNNMTEFFDKNNVMYLLIGGGMIILSIIVCYIIEKIAAAIRKPLIISILHSINLLVLLSCPVILHYYKFYNPALGCVLLLNICIVVLKLFSFAHFWDDVRKFIYKKQKILKSFKNSTSKIDVTKEDKLKTSMYNEIEEIISNYPKNVSFKALVEFLFMPILCFQIKYPRTKRIRKHQIVNYGLKVIVCIFLIYFISIQWVVPIAKNAVVAINVEDYLTTVENLVKIAIPILYMWLIMFYAFFHCALNLFAEITRFGDRQFYKDWWNCSFIDEYWRTWNLPTHFWLMRHIYNPLRRKKIHRAVCGFIVFFISALFHEYIISGALGRLHFSAFVAMLANYPASVIQEILRKSNKINKNTVLHNVFFWISFCFLGQPLCFILYFKSYYAENPQYLDTI